MASTCDVSVVIPTHNRAEFIAGAVESALAQVPRPQEIIVVNDASTDETVSVLARFAGQIKVVTTETNIERSATRNLGVQHASCKFLAFLDDDDRWREGKLAKQVGLASMSTAVFTGFEAVDCDGRQLGPGRFANERAWNQLPLYNGGFGAGSTMLIERELFHRAGGFDEELQVQGSEDWIFLNRLRRLGITCAVVPEPLVSCTVHSGSSTAKLVGARSLWPAVQLMRRERILDEDEAAVSEVVISARTARVHLKAGNSAEARSWIVKTLSPRRFTFSAIRALAALALELRRGIKPPS